VRDRSVRRIYDLLLDRHGEQGWWPIRGVYRPAHKRRPKSRGERLEIALGAILTQSTAWSNAARAIESLRAAGALGRRAILTLAEDDLAELVRSAGYFRQKARKLRAFAEARPGVDREGLLRIWGLGPETVDSILLYAHDVPVFVVDAYTRRILSRVGLARGGEPYTAIQGIFHRSLPADSALFNEFHALLVRHAKDHCRKSAPACDGCPILRLCDHGACVAQ